MATNRAYVRDEMRRRGFVVRPAEAGEPHDFVCQGRRDLHPRLVAVGPLDRERRLALLDAARDRAAQPFVALIVGRTVLLRDVAE